ncbi:MAG: hypothetical protein CSB01_00720 [Bacteroidia bacterium]|nr:MAG: hypothetical protein CSB01_00720 [Bacteroidia bacterium]
MKTHHPKLQYFLLFIAFSTLFFACKDPKSNIPEVYVDIQISIYDPDFLPLTIPNSYVYVTGGAYKNGIIIYRGTGDDFYAYDRTCPYDPDVGRVSIDEKWGILAVDTLCGSQFLLPTETVQKGPAAQFLKKYRTSFNSYTGVLRVFN